MIQRRSGVAGVHHTFAVEAVTDQGRQVPGVVDVGVGDHNCGDGGPVHRERIPVAAADRLDPLEQPAIDEQPATGRFDDEG